MKLIFPNLQNEEGKTICQLFAADFLKFLQDSGNKVKTVDLNHMTAEIEGTIDLDNSFNHYLNKIFEESLLAYNYTSRLIRRGKVDIAKKVKDPNKISEYTKEIFEPSDDDFIFEDLEEKLFAGHLEALQPIKNDIRSYRCVQNIEEKGSVCNTCGLVRGKKSIITERISLIADKCWVPFGQYKQLKGCRRCAYVLGLISNMRFLWRVNIHGKNGKARYCLVPQFKIDTNGLETINKILGYSEFLGLFRTKTLGTTSIDYIFNSLRAQPIITKIVTEGEISFIIFVQTAAKRCQGGFVTENILNSEKIKNIAEFVMFLYRYFLKFPHADGSAPIKTLPRVISDTAHIYITKGKNAAMYHFFSEINLDFDSLLNILGDKDLKTEYFINKEEIQKMNEYDWENPLVRISTFFVSEKAYQAKKNGKKPEQAINSAMALFNSFPEKDKPKIIRKYIDDITNNGKSIVLGKIDRPEEFISEFIKALNYASNKQLNEIARHMRLFANTYRYKKAEEKEIILAKTLAELGYSIKSWGEKV